MKQISIDPCTDTRNAERFVEQVSGLLSGPWVRYVTPWKRWLIWNKKRWAEDETDQILGIAKDVARSIYSEAAAAPTAQEAQSLARWAAKSESARGLVDMVRLAATQTGIPVLPADLDGFPWVLNVANGTLDLKSGTLRSADPHELLTKKAPIEFREEATCPRWDQFLLEIMAGNEALAGFLRRAVGYSLTGDCRERCLFLLHGSGRNGKSVFLDVVHSLLGDYAMRSPVETLLVKRSDGIPNDVARLRGARFVHCSESTEGRKLNESLVKDLTGRERICARFLHREFFEFFPEFKLWLGTNHKPEIRGSDPAIWDRIRLVPFKVRFEGTAEDKSLPDKLKAELAGILNWAIAGCLEWQKFGLAETEDVIVATAEYRIEQDILADFLATRCLCASQVSAGSTDLYKAYLKYCEETGRKDPINSTDFGTRMALKGFEKDRKAGGGRTRYVGVGLLNGEVNS